MKGLYRIGLIIILVGLTSACSAIPAADQYQDEDKLVVVVTTTFIRDVVENIAGDNISITALLKSGQNPHSYQPSPMDMVAITEADLILANGFGLEEFLDDLLSATDTKAGVFVVSEGITPLMMDKHVDDHQDDDSAGDDMEAALGQDPHVWFDPNNVLIWSENIAKILIEFDPDNSLEYQNNLSVYQEQLTSLDSWIKEEVDSIPEAQRELVTDHQTLGYFAKAYGVVQIGAVIPALTTEAETSGMELAELIDAIREHQSGAVFVGVDFDPSLAERVADDTGIKLVSLYFGSLSEGDPAGTYLTFMRYNVNAIVQALK